MNLRQKSISDVIEKLDRGLMEFTLFQFQVKLVLPESLKDVSAVFIQIPRINENVINVDDNKLLEHVSEHLIHESLGHRWLVSQSVRYSSPFLIQMRL